jgi:hypothetical protein
MKGRLTDYNTGALALGGIVRPLPFHPNSFGNELEQAAAGCRDLFAK